MATYSTGMVSTFYRSQGLSCRIEDFLNANKHCESVLKIDFVVLVIVVVAVVFVVADDILSYFQRN